MTTIFSGRYKSIEEVYEDFDKWPDPTVSWLWVRAFEQEIDAFVVKGGRLYLLEACKCHDEWNMWEVAVAHALSRPWIPEPVKQLIVERFSPDASE